MKEKKKKMGKKSKYPCFKFSFSFWLPLIFVIISFVLIVTYNYSKYTVVEITEINYNSSNITLTGDYDCYLIDSSFLLLYLGIIFLCCSGILFFGCCLRSCVKLRKRIIRKNKIFVDEKEPLYPFMLLIIIFGVLILLAIIIGYLGYSSYYYYYYAVIDFLAEEKNWFYMIPMSIYFNCLDFYYLISLLLTINYFIVVFGIISLISLPCCLLFCDCCCYLKKKRKSVKPAEKLKLIKRKRREINKIEGKNEQKEKVVKEKEEKEVKKEVNELKLLKDKISDNSKERKPENSKEESIVDEDKKILLESEDKKSEVEENPAEDDSEKVEEEEVVVEENEEPDDDDCLDDIASCCIKCFAK